MSDIPEHLRNALAERYDLERELGRGGMATVYLARDVRHRRDVAVKVLRAELAASLGAERFLREIEIAAQLNHPHILPLLDSAVTDGVLLYVMPYVAGESLRALMLREGALDLSTAMRITGEVAGALEYAHRKGVVHRDIKPENILLSERHAVVADFGIAKAVSSLGGKTLTRTGFPLGTPGYMSPEQAAGVVALDERTDVYGLACVVYEMLVGDTPGMWLTEEATRLQRFVDASPDHRAALDRLPGSVEQVLAGALALRPDDRYSGPRAFVEALDAATADARPRFSHGRAKAIVNRAAEIQAERVTEAPALSMGGIKRIGAEVDIPPEDVEAAARAVAAPSPAEGPIAPWHRVFGGSMAIRLERVVDGELLESEFPVIVEEVQTTLGNVGHASTLGRSLAWRTSSSGTGEGRAVHLQVMPRRGVTRIVLEERVGGLAGGLFGGIVGGGGMGGAIPITAVGITALELAAGGVLLGAGVWLAGSYVLARTLFRTVRRGRRAELEGLMDRLADFAVENAVRGAPLPPGDGPAGRLP